MGLALVAALVAGSSGCLASEVDLTVEIWGEGRVVGTAGGIDCSDDATSSEQGTCSFTSRETVTETLDAIPANGTAFVGWSYSTYNDCKDDHCDESAPTQIFHAQGTTATIPLQAYPNHGHVHVVATFAKL